MDDSVSMEEQRRSMLMRRGSSQSLDTESMRNSAIFEGRALQLHSDAPPNPSANVPQESTDPQRLFQLLRRKKKAPHTMSVPTPLQHVSPQQPLRAPLPPEDASQSSAGSSSARGAIPPPAASPPTTVARPVFSARPFSPTDRPPTVSNREVHSAQPTGLNGRPFTRQKHPKKSLDLFPSSEGSPLESVDPFPRPQLARRSSGSKVLSVNPQPRASASGVSVGSSTHSNRAVNFNCLFFKSEDELDGTNEVFPPQQHKQPLKIPLIETDWFSSSAWEQLPTTDGAPQQHDDELGPEVEERSASVYAESLYELLVASKRRPVAR